VEHRIGGCNGLSRRRRGGNSARHVNDLQSAIGDGGRAPRGPRAPRLPPARISAGMSRPFCMTSMPLAAARREPPMVRAIHRSSAGGISRRRARTSPKDTALSRQAHRHEMQAVGLLAPHLAIDVRGLGAQHGGTAGGMWVAGEDLGIGRLGGGQGFGLCSLHGVQYLLLCQRIHALPGPSCLFSYYIFRSSCQGVCQQSSERGRIAGRHPV
jgi:hypothetical protein